MGEERERKSPEGVSVSALVSLRPVERTCPYPAPYPVPSPLAPALRLVGGAGDVDAVGETDAPRADRLTEEAARQRGCGAPRVE